MDFKNVLPLPKNTAELLLNKDILKINNFNLLFNKYVSIWTGEWKTEIRKGKEKINLRSDFLKRILNFRMNEKIMQAVLLRHKIILESLQSSGWFVETLKAITDSRLIVGLGSESVLETGMILHHLYGFPYLPASGLKGLARAYAEIVENDKRLIKDIFGSESKEPHFAKENIQGKVFFLDGFPLKFPELELDIMNPHYGDYYQEKKDSKGKPIPPADYLDPNPVTFLTVAERTRFSFALYSRYNELLEKAKQWLIGGLTELGAGGKTNVGYGYFKIDSAQQQIKEIQTGGKAISTLTEKLKNIKNKETFIEFVKNITQHEIEELQDLSFEGMQSVINIGIVEDFLAIDISPEIKKILAQKMLEIIKPAKKWDDKKKERYKKLQVIAG